MSCLLPMPVCRVSSLLNIPKASDAARRSLIVKQDNVISTLAGAEIAGLLMLGGSLGFVSDDEIKQALDHGGNARLALANRVLRQVSDDLTERFTSAPAGSVDSPANLGYEVLVSAVNGGLDIGLVAGGGLSLFIMNEANMADSLKSVLFAALSAFQSAGVPLMFSQDSCSDDMYLDECSCAIEDLISAGVDIHDTNAVLRAVTENTTNSFYQLMGGETPTLETVKDLLAFASSGQTEPVWMCSENLGDTFGERFKGFRNRLISLRGEGISEKWKGWLGRVYKFLSSIHADAIPPIPACTYDEEYPLEYVLMVGFGHPNDELSAKDIHEMIMSSGEPCTLRLAVDDLDQQTFKNLYRQLSSIATGLGLICDSSNILYGDNL